MTIEIPGPVVINLFALIVHITEILIAVGIVDDHGFLVFNISNGQYIMTGIG